MQVIEDKRISVPVWVRLLDWVAAILLIFVVAVVMFGGVRLNLFGIPIRAQGLGRLVIELALVVAVRHWFVPRPSLPHRVWRWLHSFRLEEWRARWPTTTTVGPIWLATRLMVLITGYFAVVLIGYRDGAAPWRISDSEFWNLPARWDTGWYLQIAATGYTWNQNEASQQNLNFFPALPIAMRLGALMSGDVRLLAWAGVVVSILAFLVALTYLHRLMTSMADAPAADGAVLLIATYPFAAFFSAAYSESLYLVAAVGAFYHLRNRQYLATSGWGLLAGLSRPNGSFLAIPLVAMALAEAWSQRSSATSRTTWIRSLSRVRRPALAAAAMPVVGMLLYSFRAYLLTGRPFIWATLQQKAWGRTYQGLDDTLLTPLSDMLNMGAIEYTTHAPVNTLHVAAALFAIAAIWPIFRRFGLPFALLVATNTFLALLAGGLTSMGRYTSVLFPMFMWLAVAIPKKHLPAWGAAFAMGQAIIAAVFFTWRSIF